MITLRPFPWLFAFYDGREDGLRFSDEPNWVDPFALALGIASYAIVDGDEALVYDTHVSVDRAEAIRASLTDAGVRSLTVVLSHWHLDHVAGAAAFADCEVVANERTAEHLREHRAAIEAGTHAGPPAIAPLVRPTRLFSGELELTVGRRVVRLVQADVHSDDATVLWLPEERVLMAGDTLEDTVTYVSEPDRLPDHLRELDRLAALEPDAIFPSHGDPERIAAGGYPSSFLDATKEYLITLQGLATTSDSPSLREVVADALERGALVYHPSYEAVHAENVAAVRAARQPSG